MNTRRTIQDSHALIRRAKRGDEAAFHALYEEYFVPVFRYVSLRVKNRQDVEDLTQTVFLKVYTTIGRFEDRGKSPLAYFFTVARNSIIDYWKKKREVSFGATEEIPGGEPSGDANPGRDAARSETARLVHAALAGLTEDQREVVLLRFVHDMSTVEIAELMGRNEPAVRQLQVRALRALKGHVNRNDHFA